MQRREKPALNIDIRSLRGQPPRRVIAPGIPLAPIEAPASVVSPSSIEKLEFKEGAIQVKVVKLPAIEIVIEFKEGPAIAELFEKFVRIINTQDRFLEPVMGVPLQMRITPPEFIPALVRNFGESEWVEALITAITTAQKERDAAIKIAEEKIKEEEKKEKDAKAAKKYADDHPEEVTSYEAWKQARENTLIGIQTGIIVSYDFNRLNKVVTYKLIFATAEDAKQFHSFFRKNADLKNIVQERQEGREVYLLDENPIEQFAIFRSALVDQDQRDAPWCQELRRQFEEWAKEIAVSMMQPVEEIKETAEEKEKRARLAERKRIIEEAAQREKEKKRKKYMKEMKD